MSTAAASTDDDHDHAPVTGPYEESWESDVANQIRCLVDKKKQQVEDKQCKETASP
jgi:hypothetical protein